MPTIEHSLEVARPVAVAWDVWTDVRRLPELSASTREVLDAPERLTEVGQTFRQIARVAGKRVEATWTVTELVAQDHVTIESRPALGSSVRLTEQVRATAPGRTCLTMRIDYELPFGRLGKLASRFGIEGVARREAHEVLQGVARMCEAAETTVD